MTQPQLDEFMKNVRWKTAIYVAFTGGSILLASSGMYYGLKGDIRESTFISTEHYISLDRKMDSLHYIDQRDIESVRNDIKRLK